VLYRFAPSREEPRWRWVTPGSLLAAGLWLLASLAFSFYVSNFGAYDAYDGALGAELDAELEPQTRRDTTTAPDRPMGERGAFVADHVAAG
jgi:membrane protein